MKTIKKTTNKKPTNLLVLPLVFFYSLNLLAQIPQINIPGGLGEYSGIGGDIITADGKLFVHTTKSVLVYDLTGNIITTVSFRDNHGGFVFLPGGDTVGDTTHIANCVFEGSRLNDELPYPNTCHGFVFGGSNDATDILANCLFR
jgi:hypothetical protein